MTRLQKKKRASRTKPALDAPAKGPNRTEPGPDAPVTGACGPGTASVVQGPEGPGSRCVEKHIPDVSQRLQVVAGPRNGPRARVNLLRQTATRPGPLPAAARITLARRHTRRQQKMQIAAIRRARKVRLSKTAGPMGQHGRVECGGWTSQNRPQPVGKHAEDAGYLMFSRRPCLNGGTTHARGGCTAR